MDTREWLDSHVNLETGVGVPASTPRAPRRRLERIDALLRVSRLARARVPGGAHHRDERQDEHRAHDHAAARQRRTVGRFVHEPASRTRERTHRVSGRADRRRRISTSCCARSRSSKRELDIASVVLRVLTAAAFRWFADDAVDVAVVEVGLGGTWDATNVLDDARRGRSRTSRSITSSTSARRASRSRPRRPAS